MTANMGRAPMQHQCMTNGRYAPMETPLMPGDVESLKSELGGVKTEIGGIRGEVNAMTAGMAGFKGEVLTELKHLSHDLKNILQVQASFVPRREIEQESAQRDLARKELAERVVALEASKADAERVKSLEMGKADAERVKSLEEDRRWVVRQFFMVWIAGAVVAIAGAIATMRVVGAH